MENTLNRQIVIQTFCLQVGWNVEDVITNSRKIEHVNKRIITARYMRNKGYKLTDIAFILRRSHCTVIHMLRKFEEYKENNKYFREMARNLINENPTT